MKTTSFYKNIPVQPLFFALLGLLFCFWNRIDPVSVPCVSSGCQLYQNGSEGPTFWLFGCIGFFVLFLCALFNKPNLGRLCAGIGLFLDLFLFLIMVLTLPCTACLITGTLLALCYRGFFIKTFTPQLGQSPCILRRSCLLFIWSLFFIINLGLIVRGFVSPWSLNKKGEETNISIFFSPSCPACKTLVGNIPEAEVQSIAWYPVMDRSQDLESIAMLQLLLMDNILSMSENLDIASKAPPLSFFERFSPKFLLLQFRLWVNSAHVLSSGDGRLPLLEFRGVPGALLSPNNDNTHMKEDSSLPKELEAMGICGEKKDSTSCEE